MDPVNNARDLDPARGQNVRMLTEREFLAAIRAKIRETRKARGWTQEEMADAMGIVPDTYSKMERSRNMSLFQLVRFALINDLDLEILISGSSKRRGPRASSPL